MEKHFKNKLKEHQVAWDKESLWDELEAQLPTKPKRRRWVLWFLPLLLAVPFCWRNNAAFPDLGNSSSSPVSVLADDSVHRPADRHQVAPALQADGTTRGQLNATVISAPERASDTPKKQLTSDHSKNQNNNLATMLSSPAEKIAISPNLVKSSSFATATKTTRSLRGNEGVTALLPNRYSLLPSTLDKLPPTVAPVENEPVQMEQARFFVTTSLGMERVKKNYDILATDSEQATRLAQNQEYLQPRLATTVAIALGCRISPRVSASIGVGRQRIHERFNYNNIIRSDTTTAYFNQAQFFVQSSGDTLFFGGAGDYVEQDRQIINQVNQLNSTFIPIEVNYSQRYRNFEWSLGAGANWTATSKYKGRVNNVTDEIIRNPYYQLQGRWGYTLHLGFSFLAAKNRTFFTRYTYRKSPVWAYDGVRQTYDTYGLQLGMRIDFE